MAKVGHTIIKKGDIIKSPCGTKEWIVVESSKPENIKIQSLGKTMSKKEKDLMDWDKVVT